MIGGPGATTTAPGGALMLTSGPVVSGPDPNSRQARRLYIGSLSPTATEMGMKQFFQEQLYKQELAKRRQMALETGLDPDEAVKGTIVPTSQVVEVTITRGETDVKSYAFVEMNTADGASELLALDGISYLGTCMKLRRPKDYVGPVTPVTPVLPGIVGTHVPDGPNKIFMGGLPLHMTEEQIKDLLGAFGQLKNFNQVKDPQTMIAKGYCFFDFVDETLTEKVISSLNGIKLGDKTLMVQRATCSAAAANKMALALPSSGGFAMGELIKHQTPVVKNDNMQTVDSEKTLITNLLNLGMPLSMSVAQMQLEEEKKKPTGSSSAVLPGGTITVRPSRTLVLLNLVNAEELEDDEEFDELERDVEEEVEKYGRVLNLTIPRNAPDPPDIPAHCNGIPPERPLYLDEAKEDEEAKPMLEGPKGEDEQLDELDAALDEALAEAKGQSVKEEGPPVEEPSAASSTTTPAAASTPEAGVLPTPPAAAPGLIPLPPALAMINMTEEQRQKAQEDLEKQQMQLELKQEKEEEEYHKKLREWELWLRDPIRSAIGAIFVEYVTVDEAHQAQVALAGKRFGGRTVITSFLPDNYMDKVDEAENQELLEAQEREKCKWALIQDSRPELAIEGPKTEEPVEEPPSFEEPEPKAASDAAEDTSAEAMANLAAAAIAKATAAMSGDASPEKPSQTSAETPAETPAAPAAETPDEDRDMENELD